MAKISDRLDRWDFVAGEPLIVGLRWRDKDSDATLDYSDRRFALVFYLESGRGDFATIDGVAASDASGPFFRFVRDGQFTEGLRGQRVKVDLVERLLNGHDTIATGSVFVKSLGSGIVSYGDMIGRVETRFTIFVDDNGVPVMPARRSQLRYQPNGAAPYFSTPASIASDGTPQVGEVLTGVDGVVVNGAVTGRQWLLNGVAINGATLNAFTPTQTGLHTFRVTALGTDGTETVSSSSVTVLSADVLPGPTITSPADIQSDGTPQVGETLTGIDPVGNGPIVARRWIAGGVTVATTQTYAPTAAGSLRYEADLQGPDGTTVTSGSTITVAGAVTLQPLTGSGALISGTPSSGTITGKTTGSTLTTTAPGLTITGTSYTFDGTGTAGSYTITETLAGAANSPRSTTVTVQAADSNPDTWGGGGTWGGSGTWGGGSGGGTMPASAKVTGPATIVEGTGSATPASAKVTGPATITEGNPSASVAATGPSTIAEGN